MRWRTITGMRGQHTYTADNMSIGSDAYDHRQPISLTLFSNQRRSAGGGGKHQIGTGAVD